jgi:hypothetical protein
MAESKIDFSFDNLHFSCEGDKDWVEAQLNQILNRIPGLKNYELQVNSGNSQLVQSDDVVQDVQTNKMLVNTQNQKHPHGRKSKTTTNQAAEVVSGDPLFDFLKEKKADKNQVRKFLAAAVYLHSQGAEKFTTPMVSKSFKSAHIEKLINASDCLNKNEKKGFCIKDGKEFILTEAGIRSIIGGTE